jgi:hypothetical protein
LAFEALREQLKDEWGELLAKIQENPTFNNLREKFEEQSIRTQRLIVIGAALVAALFVLSFPYGYISQSQDNLAQFEENRDLIQGLLHASRNAKEPSPLPTPMPSEVLKSRVQDVLKQNQLLPEQIGEIQELPENPAKGLAPAVVQQSGLAVQVKKLNVNQVIALSHAFQTMGPGTKLLGLDVVQSEGQSHYYDMIARVVNFSLPQATEADLNNGKGKNPIKRGRKQ